MPAVDALDSKTLVDTGNFVIAALLCEAFYEKEIHPGLNVRPAPSELEKMINHLVEEVKIRKSKEIGICAVDSVIGLNHNCEVS